MYGKTLVNFTSKRRVQLVVRMKLHTARSGTLAAMRFFGVRVYFCIGTNLLCLATGQKYYLLAWTAAIVCDDAWHFFQS